ncbi:SETD3, partial [Symbiodinium pilosum]
DQRQLAEAVCCVLVGEAAVVATALEAVEARLQRIQRQKGKAPSAEAWRQRQERRREAWSVDVRRVEPFEDAK